MNILVLLEEYFPDYNASTLCAANVINELAKYHKITVLTSRILFKSQDKLDENSDQFSVIRVSNTYLSLYRKQFRTPFVRIIMRFLNWSIQKLVCADINYIWYLETKRRIKRFVDDNDVVIAFSGTFSTQQLGMYAKLLKTDQESKKKLISVFFDDLLPDINPNYKGSLNLAYNRKSISEKLFQVSDYIIFTKNVYNYYLHRYSFYKDKMVKIDLPLLDFKNSPPTNNNKPVLVYSGYLYRQFRNPSSVLEILNELSQYMEFEFHLIGAGDCYDIIAPYLKKGWLTNHGLMSRLYSDEAISKADILINIGNNTRYQTPSKIFSYINTGKRIINFYSIKQDTSLVYLRKYPLALNVFTEQKRDCTFYETIIRFIQKKPVRLDRSAITKTYYMNLPKYSCDLINKMIGVMK